MHTQKNLKYEQMYSSSFAPLKKQKLTPESFDVNNYVIIMAHCNKTLFTIQCNHRYT